MFERENIYVDKKDLSRELKYYREKDIITEELGIMIQNIVNNYATKSSFRNYTYIDDMKSSAVLRIVSQLKKVDPDKNPFAYITTIIYNDFLSFLRSEEKVCDIRTRYREKIWSDLSLEEDLDEQNNEDDE